MQEKFNFTIQRIGDFKVVRDDLIEGGTKRRAFLEVIKTITENELVYSANHNGNGAYAIALTAREVGKKVKIFYPRTELRTSFFIKTTSLSNVTHEIIPTANIPLEINMFAEKYAEKNNSFLIPIGLDFPDFEKELVKVVKKANITGSEIWCAGSSGTLANALQKAYPDIPVKVVNVKTRVDFEAEVSTIYDAPEKFEEEAEIKPPYPSSLHYDAKLWRFVIKYAKPGAFIWNVA